MAHAALRSDILIESSGRDHTVRVFLCEWFDYSYSFRGYLARLVEALGQISPATLSLPEPCPYEDFIDGSLAWNGATIAVYYEHSLGYLALTAPDRQVIDAIAKVMDPSTQVPGQGLLDRIRNAIRL